MAVPTHALDDIPLYYRKTAECLLYHFSLFQLRLFWYLADPTSSSRMACVPLSFPAAPFSGPFRLRPFGLCHKRNNKQSGLDRDRQPCPSICEKLYDGYSRLLGSFSLSTQGRFWAHVIIRQPYTDCLLGACQDC